MNGFTARTRPGRLTGMTFAGLVLLGLASCDSTPVLFPNAESVQFLSSGGSGGGTGGSADYQGEVGLPLSPAPTVRLVDGTGNPAPGVTVELEVTGGGGALGRTARVSDQDGVVRLDDWLLGQQAGANRLRLRLRPRGSGTAGPGAVALELEATGVPGPPSVLHALGVDGGPLPALEGPVGEELAPPLRFRVLDRFQNPIPGTGILADFLGSGGSLPTTSANTNAAGEAELGRWTLGPTAGTQQLRVAATGTAGIAIELEATALPGPPASLEVEGDLPDEGTVGTLLPGERFVAALDAFGNAVPGVTVTVVPDGAPAAAGSVGSPQVTGGPDGRGPLPDWTLGSQAGPQRLRLAVASAPGAPDVSDVPETLVEVLALAGPPAAMEAASPTELVGVRGSPVEPRPAVRVQDVFGNPVAGVPVAFTPAPDSPGLVGTLAGANPTTNAAGEARVVAWELPDALGTVRVEARVPDLPDLDPVRFTALVQAPARTLQLLSGGGQEGQAGSPTSDPVVVRLTGGGGAAVAGATVDLQVVAGDGTVTPASLVTNGQGEISISGWTLGPALGENRLQLSAEGAQALVVVAVATVEPPPPPETWTIDAVHLNQGNQTFLGTLPLVADRGGLLRVFLRGSTTSASGVQVRIRLRQGTDIVLDQTVSRGGGSTIISGASDPNDISASWNLAVPASLVQPGMEARVEVDPGGVLGLDPANAPRWPSGGGWEALDVVPLPTFRATFFPVEATYFGLTGRITPANQGDYLDETVDAFPVSGFDFEVRTTPFVFDGSFVNQSTGWTELLQDIRDLRLAEGAFDRYFHGIMQRPAGPGIAGIAYIASSPAGISNLAAVSFDQLPVAAEVIAHEFGHNFGRRHSPCANPSGIDPAYPHAGGGLGSPGYSQARGLLRSTTEFRDTMGYCFPMWTSDWTWGAILEMRSLRPVGSPPMVAAGAPMSFAVAAGLTSQARPRAGGALASLGSSSAAPPGLLVGGGWGSSQAAVLRTPIPLQAPVSSQDPAGEVRVELLDAQGRVLASGRYAAAQVDHADDPTLRHFGAVLPLPAQGLGGAGVVAVRVTTPAGTARWGGIGVGASAPAGTAAGQAGGNDPASLPRVVVTRVSGGSRAGSVSAGDVAGGASGPPTPGSDGALRIQWDSERWPVLVLTDPDSGRIRGFLRSGDTVVQSVQAAGELRFTVTDGLAAYRVQPEIR